MGAAFGSIGDLFGWLDWGGGAWFCGGYPSNMAPERAGIPKLRFQVPLPQHLSERKGILQLAKDKHKFVGFKRLGHIPKRNNPRPENIIDSPKCRSYVRESPFSPLRSIYRIRPLIPYLERPSVPLKILKHSGCSATRFRVLGDISKQPKELTFGFRRASQERDYTK